MDRQRQQRTSRRIIEESSSERRSMLDERKSVRGGRSLVSRLGMSEISCFPSSRSKRTLSPNFSRESRRIPNSSQRTGTVVSPNTVTGSNRQDRGKSRVNPQIPQSRIVNQRNNEQQQGFARMEHQTSQPQAMTVNYGQYDEMGSDSEEQVFEIPLGDEESPENENASFLSRSRDTETSLRGITCRSNRYSRSSSSRRDDTCARSPVQGKAKLKEHLQSQRKTGTETRRPCTDARRTLTRATEVAESSSSSSRPSVSSSSRLDINIIRSSSRSRDTSPSSSNVFGGTNRNLSATDRHVFARRNITNCFPSLGNNRTAYSSTTQAPSSSLLAASLEPMTSSNPYNSTEVNTEDTFTHSENILYSMASSSSGGWEYHRPRLMAEGLAKILMALERVESDDELTHEQFLMLEATVLFGGMALHDRHRDWRMDVDNMSYEELLELGERIGNVNTGLSKETISEKIHRSIFFSWETHRGHDNELKCSICQEEYKNGEMLGRIECGHKYHVECIKQWLVQKNLCPICKGTALS